MVLSNTVSQEHTQIGLTQIRQTGMYNVFYLAMYVCTTSVHVFVRVYVCACVRACHLYKTKTYLYYKCQESMLGIMGSFTPKRLSMQGLKDNSRHVLQGRELQRCHGDS